MPSPISIDAGVCQIPHLARQIELAILKPRRPPAALGSLESWRSGSTIFRGTPTDDRNLKLFRALFSIDCANSAAGVHVELLLFRSRAGCSHRQAGRGDTRNRCLGADARGALAGSDLGN